MKKVRKLDTKKELVCPCCGKKLFEVVASKPVMDSL